MNTLEWMVIYLPCLGLFGFYVSDAGAGLLGLLWIFGRYLYKRGYEQAPENAARASSSRVSPSLCCSSAP